MTYSVCARLLNKLQHVQTKQETCEHKKKKCFEDVNKTKLKCADC